MSSPPTSLSTNLAMLTTFLPAKSIAEPPSVRSTDARPNMDVSVSTRRRVMEQRKVNTWSCDHGVYLENMFTTVVKSTKVCTAAAVSQRVHKVGVARNIDKTIEH